MVDGVVKERKSQDSAAPMPHIEYCGRDAVSKYAGVHLIVELWDPININNLNMVKAAFEEAVLACGAKILNIDLHEFTPFGGVSGVAVLQESHMSVHTWPEYGYAAMDIFVCGTVDPHKAIPVFEKHFKPRKLEVKELKRGVMPL